MNRLTVVIMAWLALLLPAAILAQKEESAQPAAAQSEVVAAARSVVRVAIIGRDPKQGTEFLLGHGSGVAIAPGLIVTNAHVVAPLSGNPNIGVSIVPSEGNQRYPGQLLAADPRADLALIRMQEGIVPPATVFTGTPPDTGRVAALGYPGSVDSAENLSADERVSPLAAVRTFGQLSGGRSRRDVDTILHTAPMARGNSGGPLVDECGRVIGINSFGTLAEANDAEFGFAISVRELIPFLQRADVQANVTTEACVPAPAREAQALAEQARERDAAEQRLIEARELGLAVAVALIVVGALLLAGGGVAMLYRRKWKRGSLVGSIGIGVGIALMAGSVYVFLNRPSLADFERAGEAPAAAETASG